MGKSWSIEVLSLATNWHDGNSYKHTKVQSTEFSIQFVDSQEKVAPAKNEPSEIEALEGFDLNSFEPPLYRPFKPKYHLTMGMCFQKRISMKASKTEFQASRHCTPVTCSSLTRHTKTASVCGSL